MPRVINREQLAGYRGEPFRTQLRDRLSWMRLRHYVLVLAATAIPLLGSGSVAVALELEDQGPEVEVLQQQLQAAGYYNGPISGYFGTLTQEALIQFQSANGLVADGVAGPQTLAALEGDAVGDRLDNGSDNNSRNNLDPGGLIEGSQGSEVSELQNLLQTAGYLTDGVTGYFGPETTAAVRQFQADVGLTVDGIAGPLTIAALNRPAPTGASLPVQQSPQAYLANPNPSSQAPSSQAVLQRGDSGDRVRALQEKLGLLGFYRGANEGQYDVLTEAAVLEFQQVNQLPANGILDAATTTAIDSQVLALARQSSPRVAAMGPRTGPSYPSSASPIGVAPPTLDGANSQSEVSSSGELRPGSQGDAVKDLQERLYAAGFYGGPAHGFYGPDVEAAVQQFQRSRGLPETGIATPETLAALSGETVSNDSVDDSAVLDLQQQLQEMDLYTDSLDGVAGPNTEEAIRAVQQRYDIDPSDIVAE